MICKISSLFNENIDIIFNKVQEPNILLRITSPDYFYRLYWTYLYKYCILSII